MLLHETRHEQQWVEGWDFSHPDRDSIEFNAMTVQGQALRAMGWTNGYGVQKSYEIFMLYRYLIDTYQKPMSADLQKQLGFQHIYSKSAQTKLQKIWYAQGASSHSA